MYIRLPRKSETDGVVFSATQTAGRSHFVAPRIAISKSLSAQSRYVRSTRGYSASRIGSILMETRTRTTSTVRRPPPLQRTGKTNYCSRITPWPLQSQAISCPDWVEEAIPANRPRPRSPERQVGETHPWKTSSETRYTFSPGAILVRLGSMKPGTARIQVLISIGKS